MNIKNVSTPHLALAAVLLVSGLFSLNLQLSNNSKITMIDPQSLTAAVSDFNSNLVAHYTFDEGSGTTANDSAGGNDGTLMNSPTWSTSDTAIGNGALQFNGTNQYVSVPSIGSMPTNASFSFWIKKDPANTNSAVMSWAYKGFSYVYSNLWFTSSGLIPENAVGTTCINDDNWHHIVVTYGNSSETLYCDNHLMTTNSTAPLNTAGSTLNIGADVSGSGNFKGFLDDVRIYNTVLNTNQITELYELGSGTVSSTYSLTLTKGANGSVSSSPSGISCGTSCSISGISAGTTYTLTATPVAGYATTWSGCGSTTTGNTCTLTITDDTVVTVNFVTNSSLLGPNWYVDNSISSGNNDGSSWSNAFRSFADINWSYIEPGDTIYISGGSSQQVYNETLNINSGGALRNKVTVTVGQDLGHNGNVIIDCQRSRLNGIEVGANNVFISGKYNNQRHLLIKNCLLANRDRGASWGIFVGSATGVVIEYVSILDSANGIWLNQGSDFEVRNSSISGTWGDVGIRAWCGESPNTTVWDSCRIHDNIVMGNITGSPTTGVMGGGPDGISPGGHSLVYNNIIGNEFGYVADEQHPDSIQGGGDYVRIYNNTFLNPGNACLEAESGNGPWEHYWVFNNVCAFTNLEFLNQKDGSFYVGRGFEIGSNFAVTEINDVHFINNLVSNFPFGSHIGMGWKSNTPSVSNFDIVNNLVVNRLTPEFHSGCDSCKPGSSVGIGEPGKINPNFTITDATVDYNLLYAGPTGVGSAAIGDIAITANNIFNVAPSFVSYLGISASNDYHLSSQDTTARGHGQNLTAYCSSDKAGPALCKDKDGRSRPSTGPWDIGPYQYSSTPINNSIPGICSATLNTCVSGTLSDTADTSVNKLWSCIGTNGGTTAACSIPITTTVDLIPPTLSSITSVKTSTTATITWTSSEAATTQVQYGLTTAYGSVTPLVSTMTTAHSVSISSLTPNTTYHYKVISRDASNNTTTSSDYTFTTSVTGVTTPSAIPPITTGANTVPGSFSNLQINSNGGLNSPCIATTTPILVSKLPTVTFTRTLTLGSTGADIKALQIFLNTHGYPVTLTGVGSKGLESTYYGPATQKAVARFQAANQITPAVGNFGPLTKAKVNTLSGVNSSVPCSSTPPATITSTQTLTTFTRTLTLGSTGADVKALQIFLNTHGYPVATTGAGSRGYETTTFGPATQRALARFQAANNIIPNQGVFGPVTRERVKGMR